MLFDDVIATHVGHGRGQALVLLASSCSWATLAMVVLNMVFVTQRPAWECTDATDSQCMAVQSDIDSAGFCGLLPHQYKWLSPYSSLVSSFGLVCGNSWKVGLVNGMFFLGYWVGSSIFGCVADKYGRTRCLLLSNAASAGTAVLCALSSSYEWYVVWRTALGFCCPGLPVASYVLSTESVGPAHRGRAGTYSQLVYHAGEWLLPLLAFWLQDWRLLNLAIACVCILTGALVLPLPESPRWLLLQGRRQEAHHTLSWLANLNGRQLPEGLHISQSFVVLPFDAYIDADAANSACSDGCVLKEKMCNGVASEGAAPIAVFGSITTLACSQQESSSVLVNSRVSNHLNQQETASCLPTTMLSVHSSTRVHETIACSNTDDELQPDDNDSTTALLAVSGHSTLKVPNSSHHTSQAQQRSPPQQGQDQEQHTEGLGLLFRHGLLARYFCLTALLCLVMATTFYVVNLATDSLQGSLYTNFFLTSVGEVPAALIAAVAVDTIGRRVTVGTGLVITGLACCACSLLPHGWATIAMASAGKAACSGTWTVSYVYAAEVFSTSIRSAALAGTNQASRLGGIIAPGILHVAGQLHTAAAPFAFVGLMALLTAASLVWLPETLGQPQPDTVADLDRLYGHASSRRSSEKQQAAVANPLGRRLRSVFSFSVGRISKAGMGNLCNKNQRRQRAQASADDADFTVSIAAGFQTSPQNADMELGSKAVASNFVGALVEGHFCNL